MAARWSSSRCVFRVAAGPRLGYGHLRRARALAQRLDMPAVVSIRGGRPAERAAGAMGLRLVRNAKELDGATLLVVDDPSLEQGRRWIARARRAGVASVSVHDDVRGHDADLVICGSLGVGRMQTTGESLNGVRFYLLDRAIGEARRAGLVRSSDRPSRVLVALGGGQHVRRVAQQLVSSIRARCPNASIIVAAGFSRSPRPILRGARWLSARHGLVKALGDCDVAVVAGGVTLYEACALGTPAVGLAVVPEQRRAIRAFARRGAVIDAGGDPRRAIDGAASGVARLLANKGLRDKTSARARTLVDARGADRVARRIRGLLIDGVRRRA